ncbi:MAG: helix-turn-helix transcriptional regulator [Oscillatoriales cyanobacterium C42_A2020_001]|nr:helix-turn-helix transcriptional regulator [Leptolyngbyaceae cyanobacterium C42_A2020_001]
MRFEDIYGFFQNLPPTHLNVEQAVCYVLSVLLQEDSYGTELIQKLQLDYPTFRLSDTVLYAALNFLENEQFISGYWKKLEGRGRPRRMLHLNPDVRTQAEELAQLWQVYVNQTNR